MGMMCYSAANTGAVAQHLLNCPHKNVNFYSSKRPGRLFSFGTLRMGTYSNVGAYLNFVIFNKDTFVLDNK